MADLGMVDSNIVRASLPGCALSAGLAPLPTYSGAGRTESVMSGVSYQHDAFTPRTRGQKIVNYFSTKLDKVAKLMSGG